MVLSQDFRIHEYPIAQIQARLLVHLPREGNP